MNQLRVRGALYACPVGSLRRRANVFSMHACGIGAVYTQAGHTNGVLQATQILPCAPCGAHNQAAAVAEFQQQPCLLAPVARVGARRGRVAERRHQRRVAQLLRDHRLERPAVLRAHAALILHDLHSDQRVPSWLERFQRRQSC